jgi:hypothetical protein
MKPQPKAEQFKVRDERKPGHHWADNEVMDLFGKRIGPFGYSVYMYICRYAGNNDGRCYKSQTEIAAAFSISVDTVARAVNRLIEVGLIAKEDLSGKPSIYIVLEVPKRAAHSGTHLPPAAVTPNANSGNHLPPTAEGIPLIAEGVPPTAARNKEVRLSTRLLQDLNLGDAASAPPTNLPLQANLPAVEMEPAESQATKPKAKITDPRFPEICDAIRKCWPKGEAFKCDITPADAGAINRMLAAKHDWKAEELAVCIVARFMSGGVNPTESVKGWIGAITDYQSGPRDKYGSPLYVDGALNRWRNEARVILYGPQPEQLQLAQQTRTAEATWEYARDFLKHRMSPANFETWIMPLKPAKMRDGVLFLSSPRSDAKEIFSMFGDLLERAIDGRAVDVKLVQVSA